MKKQKTLDNTREVDETVIDAEDDEGRRSNTNTDTKLQSRTRYDAML